MGDLLGSRSRGPRRLRELLAQPAPLLLPGCYDALGARLIEQAGFDAAYMTGFGTSAGLLGRPDVGLLGLAEMVDNARRITQATSLPVFADADTGYGNPINVIRTVREYEQAGVAGIHIEDQVMPKKCGHMENKSVVPQGEMVAKIEAAVAARHDDDFVIIARTDARAPLGLDAAIERAIACRAAGADVLFVEALQGTDEMEQVAAALPGVPLLFNWVEGGKTPPLELDDIAALGFAAVIMPISTLFAATKAMVDVLADIRDRGTPVGALGRMPTFAEFTDLIGLPEITELEQRFADRNATT
ncbi:MAG: oxaloacetate decarboxylase [Acidimicrobiales bacterium]